MSDVTVKRMFDDIRVETIENGYVVGYDTLEIKGLNEDGTYDDYNTFQHRKFCKTTEEVLEVVNYYCSLPARKDF